MRVLIVDNNADLVGIWSRFLARQGVTVEVAQNREEAMKCLRFNDYDALVLQLVLPDGGAIAISDYATYRNPNIPIITVANDRFFSDGCIFQLIPNARSMISTPFPAGDLAALLEHVGPKEDGPEADSDRRAEAASALKKARG